MEETKTSEEDGGGGMLADVPPSRDLEGNPGLGLGGRTIVLDNKPHTAASNEAWAQRAAWVGPIVDDSAAIAASTTDVTMMVLHGTVQDSTEFPVLPPGVAVDNAVACNDTFYEDTYRASYMAKNSRGRDRDRAGGAGAGAGSPQARLVIFGVDETGRRITLHMPFKPYIYMLAGEWNMDTNKVKALWKKKDAKAAIESVARNMAFGGHCDVDAVKVTLEYRRHCLVFENDPDPRNGRTRLFPYYKVEFPTAAARKSAGRHFKHPMTRDPEEVSRCGCKKMKVAFVPQPGTGGDRREITILPKIEEDYIKPEWQAMENLAPRTWVEVPAKRYTVMPRVTHSEHDLALRDYAAIKILDRADMAPLLYCGFDLECQRGGLARGFPNWMAAEDKVFDISSGLRWWGKVPPKVLAACPSLRPGHTWLVVSQIFMPPRADFSPADLPVDPLHVTEVCEDEAHLLRRWRDLTHVWLGCDAYTGWNILKFDYPYLVGRFRTVRGAYRAMFQSRFVGRLCNTKFKKMVSNARGYNDYLCPVEAPVMDGCAEDCQIKTKRESHSLKNVAREELGEEYSKDPVKAEHMFAVWDATPEGTWMEEIGARADAKPTPEDVWNKYRQ